MTKKKSREILDESLRDEDLESMRNIGIMAHIDAGKTTATERMLYYTGRTYKMGEVHDGDAEMDWMDQEKERGITITSAATTCFWDGHQVNIIDTPGHVDFTAEVERSLRVLDGAVALFSGVEMVESQSEKVWRQADRYNIPRIAFVNKLDRTESRYDKTIEMIEERLGVTTLPLQLVYNEESTGELIGMIDLLDRSLLKWDEETKGAEYHREPLPEEMKEEVSRQRDELLENVAHYDDEVMMRYLEDEEVPVKLIRRAVRSATISGSCVPVLGGSALKNVGVQPILDAVVHYLPSPNDVPPVEGYPVNDEGSDEKLTRLPTPEEPFSSLAFKVATDQYTGTLLYLRIYSGTLHEGDNVYNSNAGKRERVSRMFHMHANRRERIEEAKAGDIVAVVGPDHTSTGETLCSSEEPIVLRRIDFPDPVISVAIEPRREADENRLTEAIHKLAKEDPTFTVESDPDSHQTIISGMGELHLEILTRRLKEEFGVDASVGKPSVTYKETIKSTSDIDEEFAKQTGGRGQYARVKILYEPLKRGTGFEFESTVREGNVPKEYIKSVEGGVTESLGSGRLAGYNVTDLKATLYDGAHHPVDSSDMAFKAAASRATTRALHGNSKLLEPIMEGEVFVPVDHVGDVMEDISKRRGKVSGISSREGVQLVEFKLPLAESFGYATRLRSITRGRGTYSLSFAHYQTVPEKIKEEILHNRGY
ncbi:elongation factor G [Candidatus Bipolaricaulota bacterium]|nr:elongation factor G [Candidatus Bipolaricaulota bacterium]